MDIPDKLKAQLNASSNSPIEVTRQFLHFYYADALSAEETRQHLTSAVTQNYQAVLAALNAIEVLLDQKSGKGYFSNLVAVYANKILADPSDEGARIWLQEVTQHIRKLLGDKQPPKPITPVEGQDI